MPRCIYCPNQIDGSEQHVLPSTIGGQWAPGHIVCGDCNHTLGNTLDKGVAAIFAELNNRLAITTGRNRPAGQIRQTSTDGVTYQVRPGGLPTPPQGNVSFHVRPCADGSGVDVSARAPTEKLARDMIERYAKRHNLKAESFTTEERWDLLTPQFNVSMTLDATLLRAAAKIGFETLAAKVSRDLTTHERFDHIREYIMDGREANQLIAFVDDTPAKRETDAFGPVDHSVIVFCNEETHTAWASIILYGGLSITVLLTDRWEGQSVGWEHRVDPLTGRVESTPRSDIPESDSEQIRERAAARNPEHIAAHVKQVFDDLAPVVAARFAVMLVTDAAERELRQHVDVDELGPVSDQAIVDIVEGVVESVVRAGVPTTDAMVQLIQERVSEEIRSYVLRAQTFRPPTITDPASS